MQDYTNLWRAADRIVYSTTLDDVSSARTRIERDFDPEAVRQLKAAQDRDISMGGAHLAGQAISAGLVDECHLILNPIVVGGGTRALPDGAHWELELVDERTLDNVHLHDRTRT